MLFLLLQDVPAVAIVLVRRYARPRTRRMIAGVRLCRKTRVSKSVNAGRSSFCVAARQQACWLLFLYLVAGIASASAQTGSSVPTAETIIARMAQARAENRARLRPYIVTRNYKLFGKDESKAKSEVIADVAFVPPDSKKYTIEETNGSGLGQILVRRMLANEAEVTKDYVSTDLSADNYDFRFIREADVSGQRCYVLELLPRRKEKHLLHGDIWVDANTYLLRRFEGELAKPPVLVGAGRERHVYLRRRGRNVAANSHGGRGRRPDTRAHHHGIARREI